MEVNVEIGVIGFGLIGGSIARALKCLPESYKLIALETTSQKTKDSLKAALFDGVIDSTSSNLEDFALCDIIFLCAPVHINSEYLVQLKGIVNKNCLITDVGSVKAQIHQKVKEVGLHTQFIGGHPMAGSEKTGYENSHAKLLENAYYILTPTKEVANEKVELLKNLVQKMNAIPLILDEKEHDDITAAISHVPHIIAAQLVNLVRSSDDETEKMRMLAAGGFKDITRIASSSPVMWQSICLSNRNSIKQHLINFQGLIQDVVDAIENLDANSLYEIFDQAGTYRSLIPSSKGMIQSFYEIFLDITDEPGAIAIIATLLGSNGISIKNIGIIHNREFEEGVLRIELYNEEAAAKATKLLSSHNYTLYER
jgi:prephenate dehydrogenase